MITLNSLAPYEKSRKPKKRVGRGPGSGHGKTACKGTKGQKSRSGASIPAGFQGGQMPLYRQLPKRGFKNRFRKSYGVLNVAVLDNIDYEGVIDIEFLQSKGLIRKRDNLVKILGNGEISRAVTVKVHAISKSAREKIEKAGGKVEII